MVPPAPGQTDSSARATGRVPMASVIACQDGRATTACGRRVRTIAQRTASATMARALASTATRVATARLRSSQPVASPPSSASEVAGRSALRVTAWTGRKRRTRASPIAPPDATVSALGRKLSLIEYSRFGGGSLHATRAETMFATTRRVWNDPRGRAFRSKSCTTPSSLCCTK